MAKIKLAVLYANQKFRKLMNLKMISRFRQRFAFLLFFLIVMASAGLYAQSGISINFKNVPLKTVLEDIAKQSKFRFVYTEELNVNEVKVSVESQNETPQALFAKLFNPCGITYVIKDTHVILGFKKQGIQLEQSGVLGKISGKVTDEIGEPLPGVTIQNKSTQKLAASELNGSYSIDAKEGDILSFVSIGMADYDAIVGKGDLLNIKMKPDAIALEDVVVTGYQTISKERSTGAFETIKAAEMAKPSTDIGQRLIGAAAGVASTIDAEGNIKFEIRGQTSLEAGAQPLVVVDGFAIDIIGISKTTFLFS